ncbi:MAG: hypothetical protein GTN71_07580 [Anaerolineae bacterium]|nr:hypothetical protein [Anaerolineae bacterium]
MMRLPVVLPVLAITALVVASCGGDGPTRSLDPAIAQQSSLWADEAQAIALLTAQMYERQVMPHDQLRQLIAQSQALAEEMRSEEPTDEVVLKLIDSLDETARTLDFVIEYSENLGRDHAGGFYLPPLEDAVEQLSRDAATLSDAARLSEAAP